MKTCAYCKIDKALSEFRNDAAKKDGKSSYCNTCNKIKQQEWYIKNKDKARQTAVKSYHNNKEQIQKRRKQHRENNLELYREKSRAKYNPHKSKLRSWKKAGIKNMSHERYQLLLTQQEHSCAICKTHQSKLKRVLNVDHDHVTGEVRGLLCDACNRALGYFKDSVQILKTAQDYLCNH